MPTVINNPPTPASDTTTGMGALVGIVVILIVAVLFFMYALPALRDDDKGTQINVPDRIQIDNGNQSTY